MFNFYQKMSSKRKINQCNHAKKITKIDPIDEFLTLINDSFGIQCPKINDRLYELNAIKILEKINNNLNNETKKQLIYLCNNLNEETWSTDIMKYIINKFLIIDNKLTDHFLFIYFFNKFMKNFVLRKEAGSFIIFNLRDKDFYDLPGNCNNDYYFCKHFFINNLKKINSDKIRLLFYIGIDSIDYAKVSIKSNDEKCEIVQRIKKIYFDEIAYYFNINFWKLKFVIEKAIECNFFILQHFCINDVSSKIIKENDISDKIVFFDQLKEYYPTIIPNQIEYFEKFEDHERPLDKDYVKDIVHTLCDPVLRKTEKGRNLESFYELEPL